MKLRYSPSSPFVRKVTVSAIETGLAERIEHVPTNTRDPASNLSDDNPLGKIPALITDDGGILYDSPVICEYLDSLHQGPKLFPPAGAARWAALRQQALADGLVDAIVLQVVESRRPEAFRYDEWIAKQQGKVERALEVLEAEAAEFGDAVTIGHIAIACALGYLDLRCPDFAWRARNPTLAGWFEAFSQRRSMNETIPRDPS